jgi:hypothetical protein
VSTTLSSVGRVDEIVLRYNDCSNIEAYSVDGNDFETVLTRNNHH